MSACEKCWRDARGDPDRYRELLEQRKSNPCSPEEQAGEWWDKVKQADIRDAETVLR